MDKGRVLSWLRTGTLILATMVAAAFGIRHLINPAASFDAHCPFGGVETLWSATVRGTFLRTVGVSNLIALGVLLIASLFFGRAFCGWLCPLGAVQEWLARLVRRLTGGRRAWLPLSPSPRLDRALRSLKYVVLALILWSSITAIVPPLQPFCPYRTLFALNLFSLLGWGVLLTFALASLIVERFWCRYLCPLGAVLLPTNYISWWRVRIEETNCASCGMCSRACPMGLDVPREAEKSGECIRCLECVHACRRSAVKVVGS